MVKVSKLLFDSVSQPNRAIVHSVDGNRINIQVRGSPTLIRNVPVSGDVSLITSSSEVQLKWEGGFPVALPILKTGVTDMVSLTAKEDMSSTGDNDSVETSDVGIRVKAGALRKSHFQVRPAEEKHIHPYLRIDGGTW